MYINPPDGAGGRYLNPAWDSRTTGAGEIKPEAEGRAGSLERAKCPMFSELTVDIPASYTRMHALSR